MWTALGRQSGSFDFPDLQAVVSRFPHLVEPYGVEYERWLNLDTGAQVILVGFSDNSGKPRYARFKPFTALLHRSPIGTWTILNRIISGVDSYDREGFIAKDFYTVSQDARPKIAEMLDLEPSPETAYSS